MIKVEFELDTVEALDLLKAIGQRRMFLEQERQFTEEGSVASMMATTEINTLNYVESKVSAKLNEEYK